LVENNNILAKNEYKWIFFVFLLFKFNIIKYIYVKVNKYQFMKSLFTLFFVLSVIPYTFSQIDHFRFVEMLEKNPHTKIATAIPNEGQKSFEFLRRENIQFKSITKEWIYVNMTPFEMKTAFQKGDIKDFYHEFSMPMALNDSSLVKHKVTDVHQGLGGLPAAYKGSNVIIGVVDQGLDHNHPDFKDAQGNSRVLRYWDHTMPFDAVRTPQPYNYGQVWKKEDIDNGICTSNEETTGHGTTVCGAAAGNGLANGRNKGMAPESNIIFVETNFSLPNWTLTIADACDYIFKVADTLGMPAVVNLSLGTYLGSHDGNDPASNLIESLLDAKPGRIVIAAAGNSGHQGKYHVRGINNSDTTFVWLKNNPAGALGANSIYYDLWANVPDIQQLKYAIVADRPAPNYGKAGSTIYRNATQAGASIFDTIRNANGDRIATIQFVPNFQLGAYRMEALIRVDSTNYLFRFSTAGTGMYDMWSGAWLGLSDFETNLPSPSIMPEIVKYTMPDTLQTIVSSWNCSEKVVSVGNIRNLLEFTAFDGSVYNPNDGGTVMKLAATSSKGPSRLNVVKPTIVATGDVSLSSAPFWIINSPDYDPYRDQGNMHVPNGGTSMSAPVVAGIAALYLEKCPTSSYAKYMEDMQRNAMPNQYTGILPNFAYGYGLIDALSTLRYNAEIEGGTVICESSTELTAVTGTPINSVTWSNSSTSNPLTVNEVGTYTATIIYNGSCQTSASASVNQGTIPTQPMITNSGGMLESSSAANYQWYLDGNPIEGATNQTYNATEQGVYSVSTTSSDGCTVFSEEILLLGLWNVSFDFIKLYPNPTENGVTISGLEDGDLIHFYDLKGLKVHVPSSQAGTYDLKNVSNGVYFVNITRKNQVYTIKLIRN
jgi:hypothetical protein